MNSGRVDGQDVDPRYSLANERTFLAWIRTALGLLAGAVGLLAVDLPWPDAVVRALGVLLAVIAGLSAFLAWRRWARVEAAIRAKEPVPTPRAHVGVAGAVTVVAAAVIVLALV